VARGFYGTSMSMIARKAGISPATIYYHFESRDDLIHQLYLVSKGRAVRAAMIGHDESAPLREQVFQLNGRYMRYLLQHPDEAIFIAQYERSPYHRDQIQIEERVQQIRIFQQAMDEQFVKGPVPLIRAFTTGAAGLVAEMCAAGELEMTDEIAERVLDMSWDAIRS
jgi:AcrR family transcriptional regulator